MVDKSGTTILVVDDAPENIKFLSRIFIKDGYFIQVADKMVHRR
jgi:CheY-like chemotaxis protein